MKRKTKLSIAVTTIVLMVYIIFATLPISCGIVFSLFVMSSASLLWMVYAVLTDTTSPTTKTFDEYFYEDADHRPMK